MAIASIFGTNLFHYQPDGVIELYQAYPAVRDSFARAAGWTGIGVEALLHQNGEYADDGERIRAVSVGLAAAQLGIQDVLSEVGLRPHLVGGLSLGGLVSSCVAGALGRRELMELLTTGEHRAGDEGSDQAHGIASAYLPTDVEPADQLAGREGIFIGSDFGVDASGRIRIVLLSGYRHALEAFAAEQPDGMVTVTPGVALAVHSPLRARAGELTRVVVDRFTFTDPELPLCSGLAPATLTTAEQVREMFVANVSSGISLPHLTGQLAREGTQLGVVIGPSPVMNALRYPFPVVFVDSAQGISQAVAAVFEHGVSLRRG